jgi:hypothetical protein
LIETAVIPEGVLEGIIPPENVECPIDEGMWCWTNPKGWRVVAIHYRADPDKRPETPQGDKWHREAKKATRTLRDWKREMDIDFTVSSGEPFYGVFNRRVHVKPCKFDPDLPLIRGWDFGRSRPACIWGQLHKNLKFHVLYCLMGKNKNIFQFTPLVTSETNIRFPRAKVITDYGDPAGAQETDKGATTMILLLQFGIQMVSRFSFVEEGTKIIEQKLMVQTDGEPGIFIDPACKDLIDGFAGGYKLDTTKTGKNEEGVLKNRPRKDGYYDHLQDALRYIFVNIFSFDTMSQGREHAAKAVGLWQTNAERRNKETSIAGRQWAQFLG